VKKKRLDQDRTEPMDEDDDAFEQEMFILDEVLPGVDI